MLATLFAHIMTSEIATIFRRGFKYKARMQTGRLPGHVARISGLSHGDGTIAYLLATDKRGM
jgi:hypothetical protein